MAGPDFKKNRAYAQSLLAKLRSIPGAVDLHIQQPVRLSADQCRRGPQQGAAAGSDPAERGIQPARVVVRQFPDDAVLLDRSEDRHAVQRRVADAAVPPASLGDLGNTPLSQTTGSTSAASGTSQILSNIATFHRSVGPPVVSHYNAQTAVDIYGTVQGTDLGYVAGRVQQVLDDAKDELPKGSHIVLKGQVQTMQGSFNGLLLGLLGAIVLVYLLIVVNFQSYLDPLIIIAALPAALAGIVWMLFLTGTTVSACRR